MGWSADKLWLVTNILHSSSLVPFPLYSPPVPQCLYTGMYCTQWPWLFWGQSWEILRSVMCSCHLVPGWDTSAQRITQGNLFLKTSPLNIETLKKWFLLQFKYLKCSLNNPKNGQLKITYNPHPFRGGEAQCALDHLLYCSVVYWHVVPQVEQDC